MGLLSYDPMEDGDVANANLWNVRLSAIHDLINGNIDAANLANGAVTTAKIAQGAVTAEKIDFDDIEFFNWTAVEQDTGMKWVDGNPIYRKCFTFTTTPPSALGVTIAKLLRVEMNVKASTGEWHPVPFNFASGSTLGSASWFGGWYIDSSNNFHLQAGTDLANFASGVLIIEYTKV